MHPILFTLPDWFPLLGGSPMYAYGLLLGLSLLLGWVMAARRLRHDRLSEGQIAFLLSAAALTGLLGARLLQLVLEPGQWKGAQSLLRFDPEGAMFFGGLVLASATVAGLARLTGASPWRTLDRTAPGLALGLILTHLGSFFHGAGYGRETSSPLGVRFPLWSPDDAVVTGQHGPPALLDQLLHGAQPVFEHLHTQIERIQGVASSPLGANSDVFARAPAAFEAKFQALATLVAGGESTPVLPTQLLVVAVGLVAFLGVLVSERRTLAAGQLFLGWVAFIAAARFGLDFTRGDLSTRLGPLASTQVVALGLFVVSLTLWLWRTRRTQRVPTTRGTPSDAAARARR